MGHPGPQSARTYITEDGVREPICKSTGSRHGKPSKSGSKNKINKGR